MQTTEPSSTRESTERMVKNLDSTYAKLDHEHVVANARQLNSEEITLLLIILQDFEDLIDDTLGDWDTDSVNL